MPSPRDRIEITLRENDRRHSIPSIDDDRYLLNADAVVALGDLSWYCPACGVLYSRDEDATSAPPHPNPLEPDANCTGTPTAGLWIPDDESPA